MLLFLTCNMDLNHRFERTVESIAQDSLALSKFDGGKKNTEAKLGIREDEIAQSRADREIEPFVDAF